MGDRFDRWARALVLEHSPATPERIAAALRQAREEALEEAMAACEQLAAPPAEPDHWNVESGLYYRRDAGMADGAQACADAIRALKERA